MGDEREDENQVCPCGEDSHAPPAVLDAIRVCFPANEQEILRELRYHYGEDMFSFNRWGMFVGVERDGYIHT